jgi:hypothetical protein
MREPKGKYYRTDPFTFTAPEAPKPAARPLPVCPRCGWAALFLVLVVPPMRFKSAPPKADMS